MRRARDHQARQLESRLETRPRDNAARVVGLAVALVIVAAAYVNSIPGEFVYDDAIQIVQNPYIQEGRHFRTAVTSDVWAFKGAPGEARSNYWRPAFVLWLILNFRLFGLEPAGWHVTNILLHAAVVALAAGVLRRLDVRPAAAAVILWIFAAHPVHTESVAWISGSPDLLLGVFLLAGYWVHLANRPAPSLAARTGALALFAAAALCKEVGVVFPLLILATEWALIDGGGARVGERFRRSLRATAPYLLVAALYLLARLSVLGMLGRASPWAPSASSMILSMPRLLAFYTRQALWPATLGPDYPVRAVEPAAAGRADFLVPLLAVLAGAFVAALLWRRGPLYKIGITLYLVLLAPAMNVAAFLPEQLVHDRYLYLPLLGLLVVVVGTVAEFGGRRLSPPGLDRALYAGGVLVASALLVLTVRYNRVWSNDIALWERGVAVDPVSSHTLGQLGNLYRRAGRVAEARELLERAQRVNPGVTRNTLELAIIDREEGRFAEAVAGFERVLDVYPDHEVALDQLGATFQVLGRHDRAERLFRDARERLPHRKVKYTMNIAIIRKLANRPGLALLELESIRDDLERETSPDLLRAYYFLGELYREAGRPREAAAAYRRFLERTSEATQPPIERLRADAARRLAGTTD